MAYLAVFKMDGGEKAVVRKDVAHPKFSGMRFDHRVSVVVGGKGDRPLLEKGVPVVHAQYIPGDRERGRQLPRLQLTIPVDAMERAVRADLPDFSRLRVDVQRIVAETDKGAVFHVEIAHQPDDVDPVRVPSVQSGRILRRTDVEIIKGEVRGARGDHGSHAVAPLDLNMAERDHVAVRECKDGVVVDHIAIKHPVTDCQARQIPGIRHEHADLVIPDDLITRPRKFCADSAVTIRQLFLCDVVVGLDHIIRRAFLITGIRSPEMLPSGDGKTLIDPHVVGVRRFILGDHASCAVCRIVRRERELFKGQIAIVPAGKRRIVESRIVAGRKVGDKHGAVLTAYGQTPLPGDGYGDREIISSGREKQYGILRHRGNQCGERGGNTRFARVDSVIGDIVIRHGSLLGSGFVFYRIKITQNDSFVNGKIGDFARFFINFP